MKNILVIGAGGFIGKSLSDELYHQSANLFLFGNDIKADQYPNAHVHNELIKDFNVLNDFITDNTYVYYLINTISPTIDDHSLILNDVSLFVKFLSWASQFPNLHIIYTSSGGTVYKESIEPITEEHETMPISYYGMAKLTSENYLKLFAYKYNLRYTITRIANPYGIGQAFIRNQGLIPLTYNKIHEGEPILIYGKGDMIRDYINIKDLTAALSLIPFNQNAINETLNLGSGLGVKIIEVISTIEESLQITAPKEYHKLHSGHVKCNMLDISKAIKVLNWKPTVTFKEGICDLTAHYNQNKQSLVIDKPLA